MGKAKQVFSTLIAFQFYSPLGSLMQNVSLRFPKPKDNVSTCFRSFKIFAYKKFKKEIIL